MFPTQSKVQRTSRLWLLPVITLAMLLVGYAVFASATAQAQTPTGDVCVEGLVIDWEEKPLAGWVVTLTREIADPVTAFVPLTTTSAPKPEDDDPEYKSKKSKKYPYEYPEVDPEFEKGEFKFSESDIADATTSIAATGTVTGAVVSGLFTATIESRPGWEGVTPTTIDFPIEDGQDGCVKIRFKMRRVVPVTVYKIDADHQPLGDWRIKAVPGPGNLFATPQEETTAVTTSNGVTIGSAVFTLTPGLWIFTEMAPKQDRDEAPNAYVPIVPPNGRQELLIPAPADLEDDAAYRLVFKNELVTGCFYVEKLGLTGDDASVLGPSYTVAGWGFKLLRKDGSVARQGVTDGNGRIRFDNLPLGPYVIVEEDRPGWNEVTARKQDILVTGNNCVGADPQVVTFENEQDDSGFCIEGRKVDANGGYGIFGWEIKIKALDTGGADPTNGKTVYTNGLGEFRFDFPRSDYRVPGAKYEVCEQAQDGWLPHTETCQTVRLPEWPGACVQLEDFVNQQVGHSESQDHGKGGGKGDSGKGGPNHGGDIKCSSYHEVKAGEGLFEIGARYNVSPQAMLDANPDVRKGNELWVFVGQKICIP